MRINTSGLTVGMAALLLGAARAWAEQPQDEGGPPEAPAESAPGEISGTVKQITPEGVVRVAVPGVPDVQVHIKARTIVVLNGQMSTMGGLQVGDKVRTLYRDIQGQPIAIMVDATGPARAAPKSFE